MENNIELIRKKVLEVKKNCLLVKEKLPIDKQLDAQIKVADYILSFIDSLQEEPVNDDLEEVAKEYEEKGRIDSVISRKRDFINGAKWQKQQMMKGAILIK